MRNVLSTAVAVALCVFVFTAPAVAEPSNWVGAYKCGQGVTAVSLRVEPEKGEKVGGFLVFYPSPPNPNVGTLSADGRDINLVGAEWIEHPDRYEMVNLEGRIDATREIMTGRVIHPGDPSQCSWFALVKQ